MKVRVLLSFEYQRVHFLMNMLVCFYTRLDFSSKKCVGCLYTTLYKLKKSDGLNKRERRSLPTIFVMVLYPYCC